MRNIVVALIAAAGATLLSVAYLAPALKFAGPYKELAEVRLPVSLSLFLIYLAVCAGTLLGLRRVLRIQSPIRKWLAFLAICAAACLTCVLAPALPFLVLALICKYQPLCPEYANPIGWSLFGLVGPIELPFAPTWMVVGAGVAAYLLRERKLRVDQ